MSGMGLEIAGRRVGEGEPTLVIAEIGVNHDGSLGRALELVGHAARVGADAVKLQIFQAKTLMHGSAAFAAYQQERCADADPAAMLRRYELAPRAVGVIVEAIRAKGMLPLATPFSPGDVETIERLELPAVKIASPDLVNWVLLKRAAEWGRPMLVSTGAATMEEVVRCAGWLRGLGVPFAFLHCVSSYPTPMGEANLGWIEEIRREVGVAVGYSDHTTEEVTGALAVAAGAVVVEKHLTYDRGAEGPDHSASADPGQFERYVKAIRVAEVTRGVGGKRVLPVEEDVRRVSRQSLVARRALRAGETVRDEDLTVQRPGTAISAGEVSRVVGRRMVRDVPAGEMIQWDMLAA